LARLRAASEDAARSESRRHALRSKPRIAAPPAAEASAAEEAGAAVAVEDGTTIIRGRVRDAHGRPLEGVQIIVQRDGETTVLAEAVSDASGAYEIRADGFDARDGEAFWLSRKLRLGISDLTASFSGSFVEDGNAEAAEPAPAEDEERVRYLAAVERAQEEQAERLVRLRMERSRANLEAAEAALKQSAAEADAAAAAAAQAAESFARVEDIEASLRLEEATRLLRYEQSYSLAVKAKWLAYSRDDNGARVRLAARIEGYETAVSAPIEVHNGELVEMDFDLADAQVLRGRVLTASGHPIAGATVTVAARVDELPLPEAGRSLECGDDGGFRFEALPEGVYLLRAEAPGYLPQEIVGSPGSAASVFALAYSGGLRVRVVRGGGGEALAGWNVEIGRGERPLHSTGTLESGEAAFDTLVPGEYRVRAAPPEGEPALGERTAAAWVQAGREVELRIEVWERVETASHPPETAVETAFRVDEAFIIAAVQAEEDAGAAKAAEEPAVRVAVQDRASLRGLMSLAEALGLAWAPRAPLSEDAAIQAAAIVEGPKVGKLRDLLDEAAEMAR
jgi:protocatechuate 3,4-dioxygenase beta subunit